MTDYDKQCAKVDREAPRGFALRLTLAIFATIFYAGILILAAVVF